MRITDVAAVVAAARQRFCRDAGAAADSDVPAEHSISSSGRSAVAHVSAEKPSATDPAIVLAMAPLGICKPEPHEQVHKQASDHNGSSSIAAVMTNASAEGISSGDAPSVVNAASDTSSVAVEGYEKAWILSSIARGYL